MDSESRVPDPPLITPYTQFESDHHLFTPEKSLGRPEDRRVVPTSPVHRLEDSPVEATGIPFTYGVEQPRDSRYEMDGGVRVAEGRVGDSGVAVDYAQHTLISEGSTLPPPYSSHVGET